MKSNKKYTPEEFEIAVKEYFNMMEAQDRLPDLPGMKLCLGIYTDKAWSALTSEDNPHAEEFRDILDYAAVRRESWLVRTMTSDNKRATGCYYALKQKENGAYSDKPQADKDKTLNIKLHGVKNGEEALK